MTLRLRYRLSIPNPSLTFELKLDPGHPWFAEAGLDLSQVVYPAEWLPQADCSRALLASVR